MRRAERVVDVEVAAVGELAGEALVVLRLARVEARVLEHRHAVVAEELGDALAHRRHRVLGAVLLGLRPAEVRADAHLARAAVEQQPQRRQRGLDAGVVGDAAVLERDVQVGPDEDDLPVDVGVANRARQRSLAASLFTRSTSRHE